MAVPQWIAAGSVGAGTTSVSPGLPSGWQEDDILLLCVESTTGLASTPSGWTQVPAGVQFADTAVQDTALNVYYRRATSSESSPSFDAGDHTLAIIHAVRGCVDSGSPIDDDAGSVETTSDTSGTAPAVTTTGTDRLIFIAACGDADTATPNRFTAVSNANLSSLTERSDSQTSLGGGGILGVFTGEKDSAGSTGTTSITYAVACTKGLITLALTPIATISPSPQDCVGMLIA